METGQNINGIAQELAKLTTLVGSEFSRQVVRIAQRHEFHLLVGETSIFSVGGEQGEDYVSLLNAAHKAVTHGYRVFILPNPSGSRTPDFIFERKGIYKTYDLKTIQGKASVMNRLLESIGQSNRVLLNLVTNYNGTALARCIIKYFERNANAIEVLIFKGNKIMSITRKSVSARNFVGTFCRLYYK